MEISTNNNNFINNSTCFKQNRQEEKNFKRLKRPLNSSVQFRGLFNPISARRTLNSILPNKTSVISEKLEQKACEILQSKSKNLAGLYIGFKKEFLERIKNRKDFRIKLGIDKEAMAAIEKGAAVSIPEKSIMRKFISNLFSPLRIFSDAYSFVMSSRLGKWAAKHSKLAARLVEKNEEVIKDNQIIGNYKSYTGLIESIKIWEAKQRKLAGLTAWDETKPLLTSTDILESKAMRRWLKSVDPTKGQYNIKHQMLGNRLISGLVYGVYLANDAYNTTIRYSNNTEEAKAQRRTRFAQEAAKIGIYMYLTNFIVGTFEKYVNKSLFNSMFSVGATTMTTEILGRKLVGRPIFPSDKETLEKMSKDMKEKKGFWVSVGRVLSGTKAGIKTKEESKKRKFMVLSDGKVPFRQRNEKLKNPNNISFGSFYKATNYMKAKTVKSILDILKEADSKIYKNYVDIINKSLKKENKDLAAFIKADEKIPIGTKKTILGNLVKSFASPYFFVRDTGKQIVSGVKKIFSSDNTVSTFSEMKTKLGELDKKNPGIKKEYYKFLQKMKDSALWKESSLNEKTQETRILSEFLEALQKDTEEIEGVKNIFLFLDKRLKSKDLTKENVEKMKKLLFENFKKTDGAGLAEYDGNSFAMWNINLARAITTLFLVVDAYNLSIQYSNNDIKAAINNGKSRAMQEASRISVSAYMLAFVHNLLSKFCNASLAGAFTTTAITSSMNDAIARKVVGVPIGTKTYEELAKIDKENEKSKSPFKRTLAYLVGKKSRAANPQYKNKISNFSLNITKSFKTMLDEK